MKSPYVQEHYEILARQKGLRARSYFKLAEIDKKYQLIQKTHTLLDVGSAPGSWLQYCLERTKQKINLYALDLQPLEPLPRVTFLQKSIFDVKPNDFPVTFNGITSDMAPKTTGIKDADSTASFDLVFHLLTLSKSLLKSGGFVICKYLEGQEKQQLLVKFKQQFDFVKVYTPAATRRQSRECFIIAKDKR